MSGFKISSITNLQHLFNSGLLLGVPVQYTTALQNNQSIFYNATLGIWQNGSGGTSGTSIPDGTVTEPGLYFAAETDTGIYRVGTNDMGFTAGGTEVHRAVRLGSGRPKLLVGDYDSSVSPLFQVGSNTLWNRVYHAGSGSSKTFTFNLAPNSTNPALEYSPCIIQIGVTTGTRNSVDEQIIGSKRITTGFIRLDNNTMSDSTVLEDINSGTYPSMTITTNALLNGFSVTITTPTTGIQMKNVVNVNYTGGELYIEDVTE